MNILDIMHARRSVGKLTTPAPTTDELLVALQCAMVAPDHKQLKPYHFTVLTDEALDKFGKILLDAGTQKAQQDNKPLDETARTKLINMPKRAPMIIAVATNYQEHSKVPPFEQLLCVGAVIQNMLLVFEHMGYHTIWRTGDLCNEPAVKEFFGASDDNIVCGFIYVGTSNITMPTRDDVVMADFITFI